MPNPHGPIPDGGEDSDVTVALDTEQIQAVASQFQSSATALTQVASTLDQIFSLLIHFDTVIPDPDLQRTLAPLIDGIAAFHTDMHTSVTNTSAWIRELSVAQFAIAADHASLEQGSTSPGHGGPIPQ